MRRALAPLVVAIVCGLGAASVLAACSTAPTHPHVSAAKNRTRAIVSGDRYVALGDSYTAAPYTGPTVADDGCIQSSTNYPHQLAAALGLRLDDVSCGGSLTSSITGSFKTSTGKRKVPQLDAVTRDTALVTVSIGANDGQVFAAMTSACLNYEHGAASGAPCRTIDAGAGRNQSNSAKIGRMELDLENVLAAVIRKAPEARVIVVGYPSIVPPAKPCAQFPFATGDVPWARHLNELLAHAQQQAARAVGAEYVDMLALSAGHDVCGAQPWIAGVKPVADAAPFHPYPVEQLAVANALRAELS